VPFGTEEHQTFIQFLKALNQPMKIVKRMKLPLIHLAPRSLCNPVPLGQVLKISQETSRTHSQSNWLELTLASDQGKRYLTIGDSSGDDIKSIEYRLSVDDIFPKPHGLLSKGRYLLVQALSQLGIGGKVAATFEASLQLKEGSLKPAETAVLERLVSGTTQVVLDTVIGSPKRLESLMKSGHVVLLPNFNHLGIRPDYLVSGNFLEVNELVSLCSLESTVLVTEEEAFAVVSSPGTWGVQLRELLLDFDLRMCPILTASSSHGLLRGETVWPDSI
jgi:hypothetical protein